MPLTKAQRKRIRADARANFRELFGEGGTRLSETEYADLVERKIELILQPPPAGPSIAGMPARCLKCGLQFSTPDLLSGTSVLGELAGVLRHGCPKCGGSIEIKEGMFHVGGDGYRLVDAPPDTRQTFGHLADIAKRARERLREKTIETEEVLSEIADVSPELATKLRAKGLPIFVVVLVLLWMIKSFELGVTIDLNHLIDQAYHWSHGEDPDKHLDAPLPLVPTPAPPPREPQRIARSTERGNRHARRRTRALKRRK